MFRQLSLLGGVCFLMLQLGTTWFHGHSTVVGNAVDAATHDVECLLCDFLQIQATLAMPAPMATPQVPAADVTCTIATVTPFSSSQTPTVRDRAPPGLSA